MFSLFSEKNRNPKRKRKTDLTTDCRLKSDARNKLIKLQIESAIQDTSFKKEKHERKMEYLTRDFELSQEKKKN